MNRLLADSSEIIPLIIIIIGVVLFFVIIIVLKNSQRKKSTTKKPISSTLTINENYCTEIEMKFLEALHKALPREFIAFPYVGVDNLVIPKNGKVMYNKILTKYVDVCVFLRRNMQPVLAIDLFNSNPVTQALKKMDTDVYDALKCIGIPVIVVKLVENYDLNILRKNIIDSLPDKVFALIKDKVK